MRDDGKQDVDGHGRSTSTFIIEISDRINFVILMVEDLNCVLHFARQVIHL